MKQTASARSNGKLSTASPRRNERYPYYVMRINNRGWEISPWPGKVYRVIKPEFGDAGWIRVIDEESENYLYPPRNFVRIELPAEGKKAVIAAAGAQ